MTTAWQPRLGAWPELDGVRFSVWAPVHERIDVVWWRCGAEVSRPLDRAESGTHRGWIPALEAGTRYKYRLPDGRLLPDPASRFQPEGVHGPSEVVDPSVFRWTDERWCGISLPDAIIYELHVGTFTEAGSFGGVQERLEYLKALGITAIELMPIAESVGRWNWGYDCVDLFAPSHNFGRPDDLRALVDAAHRLGIAVFLDVVYNHFGPEGAYAPAFSPYYFTDDHQTPWGPAINLHGAYSTGVREFLTENALHWVHEYHIDGLRLDATHAMHDDGRPPFLAQLAGAVHDSCARRPLLMAEDNRNEASLASPSAIGGCALDGLWADDFHHQIRRAVAGDADGYFQSYTGEADDIATTLQRGWFFCGQVAAHTRQPLGSDPLPLGLEQFIICLQNHDQIGNRAFGDRLHTRIAGDAYRAVSALLLCAPETPLLFMGQEWGATTPFLFFTDHEPELGRAVTVGRRAEFATFAAFSDPLVREMIPDPQAELTFLASRLRWSETTGVEAQGLLRLYRALLAFRRTTAAVRTTTRSSVAVHALDPVTIAMWRDPSGDAPVLVVTRLSGRGSVTANHPHTCRRLVQWTTVLTTADEAFSPGASRPRIREEETAITVSFDAPATVVLRGCARSGRTSPDRGAGV